NVGSVDGFKSSETSVKQEFGPALEAQPKRPVSFYLYFQRDTDEFAPESTALVKQIFAEIARRPAPEVAIIGHTDRVGSMQYNDALSLRRAERCREELIKLGIPKVRITVAGGRRVAAAGGPRPRRGPGAAHPPRRDQRPLGPFQRSTRIAMSSDCSTPSANRLTSRRIASPISAALAARPTFSISASKRARP